MSTRCNILIEYGSTRVFLYRHHDGDLANTGADLLDKMRLVGETGALAPSRLVQVLLQARYDGGDVMYQITTDYHGDISYAYRVIFSSNAPVQIGWMKRDYGMDYPTGFAPTVGTIEAFEKDVVAAEKLLQANIKAREAQQARELAQAATEARSGRLADIKTRQRVRPRAGKVGK